jgi:hypothetical protein
MAAWLFVTTTTGWMHGWLLVVGRQNSMDDYLPLKGASHKGMQLQGCLPWLDGCFMLACLCGGLVFSTRRRPAETFGDNNQVMYAGVGWLQHASEICDHPTPAYMTSAAFP